MHGRKGQSQVLTAVLLGGILVAAISSAYLWAIPILQKNQDVNDVEDALNDMKTVTESINDVAQEGGSRSVDVSLGSGTLNIDTSQETITYRALTKGAYVSTSQWVPLNENDVQGVPETDFASGYGIRGTDKPGVLVGQAEEAEGEFLTMYRSVFRKLKDPNSDQTYQIDLVQNGNTRVSGGGDRTITFRKQEETTEPGAGIDGGALRKIRILIRVS